MKLYNFFRSGTSHRTRIVMNLKGLDYDYVAINLTQEAHLAPAFKVLNPQGLVPVLEAEGQLLFQSPAIIEWLEERYPEPALLPKDPFERAHVRALAAMIGCDIHPINNRRILNYLRNELQQDETAVLKWCNEWITEGFDALEQLLSEDNNRQGFCFGDKPTIADAYLIPQIESAKRFEVDLTPYPLIREIEATCMQIPAFIDAAPFNQPDAPTKA